MKKLILMFLAAAGLIAIVAGCGHSVGSGFSGKMINVGYDPETNKAGIQYWNGTFGFAGSRENTSVEVTKEDSDNSGASATSTVTATGKFVFKSKTGRQINGRTVEAIEAGAKPSDINAMYVGTSK